MTEELNMIEKANEAAKRMEHANKVMEELVKRQESIEARRVLGGKTEAGAPKEPEVSEEDKIKADNLNYFKGTAIEQALKNG